MRTRTIWFCVGAALLLLAAVLLGTLLTRDNDPSGNGIYFVESVARAYVR